MSFATLALILAVALCGPLLAWKDSLRLPVIIGELAAGVIVGQTGTRWVDAQEPTLVFLASIGFGLVMFVSGWHVPVQDTTLLRGVRPSLGRLAAVVVAAVVLGVTVAWAFGTGHAGLYAVLFASSSAAVVMPVLLSLHLPPVTLTRLIPQVALADAACIVALPLVLQPNHAGRAALGAALVIAGGAAVFALLWWAGRRGWLATLHEKSKARAFALELRASLLVLLLMAALAQWAHVSIMLPGFCLGLAVAGVGRRRRLARQLFGLTEGLFGPIFFVWLGASLNLRELGSHPSMILLGVVLALAAVAAHAVAALFGLTLPCAILSAAQIGVPVAAVTIGQQEGVLAPGEGAAVLLGALLTIVAAAGAGRHLVVPDGSRVPGAA